MPPDALHPLPARAVDVRGGSWGYRMDAVAQLTVPHCLAQCEATGRLRNFDRAAGRRDDDFEGRVYDDSDVYKTLEGAAWALARCPSPDLERATEDAVQRVVAAAGDDGYLNTWHQTHTHAPRYGDVRWKHELYCVGHLLEAGLAHATLRRDERLLDTALAAVDHAAGVFGPGRRREPPGHPEIELALLALHAQRGRPGALDLARFFLEQRGETRGREGFGDLCQDHLPLREQREAAGHAVRATYLYAAAADLVRLAGDRSWLPALDALWSDVVDRRMYVTGGIGSSAENEGFTAPYDLPNAEAYAETCAAIGLVLWARRMAWLHADASYVDVMERALLNGVLAGLSLTDTAFFYVNPLASDGRHVRRPWFDCACCPTNLARLLPSLGTLAASRADGVLALDLYLPGTVEAEGLRLRVEEGLPFRTTTHVVVERAPKRPIALRMRVPGWARSASVCVNDQREPADPVRGYVEVLRVWRPGEEIRLHTRVPVERERADPRVAANRGRVALRRGAVVYAVEAHPPLTSLEGLRIPDDAVFRPLFDPAFPRPRGLSGGVPALVGEGVQDGRVVPVRAIPYAFWGNHDHVPMAVWLES